MKMAKGKAKNAIIATGWSKAMKTYEIKEGAICIFEFYVDMKGKLGLMIHSVPDALIHLSHQSKCSTSLSHPVSYGLLVV
jgi:hypothetical protein